MTAKLNRRLVIAAVLLILATAGFSVYQFEQTLKTGRLVNIELAPVDPRSIMQGDYMALAFAIDRVLPDDARHYTYAWLQLDDKQRASLHSLSDTVPTAAALVAVLLRQRDGSISIGPNAFFFTEGSGELYEPARYGQFRIDANGKALLTGLLDENMNLLGENER